MSNVITLVFMERHSTFRNGRRRMRVSGWGKPAVYVVGALGARVDSVPRAPQAG